MAEYCSQCNPYEGMEPVDIELSKLALDLDRGHSESFICEGCLNRALYKDEEGRLWLARLKSITENELTWVPVNLGDL